MEKLNGMAAINPQNPVPSSEPSTGSMKTSRRCEPGWLSTKIRMLFSSYRLDQFPDPEAFMAQIGTVLEQYDPQVVSIATSPLTGIQRKCKFPPSIAEVVEFCDQVRADIAATAARREAKIARPERAARQPIEQERSYEAMFKQYGRPIGFFE
jgi:hypothetical protein